MKVVTVIDGERYISERLLRRLALEMRSREKEFPLAAEVAAGVIEDTLNAIYSEY